MKKNSIRIIIVAGIISIVGIISAQLYFIHESLTIKEKQLNQTINIALRSVAEHLYKFNENTIPFENPVYQYSNDYFVVNLNGFVTSDILEHYLINEFKHRNILLDFEYAIYDCQSDHMIYGKYIRLSDEGLSPRKSPSLAKCNQYLYYFGVFFPGRSNYIISSMKLWYFFSSILAVVIIFLGYSLFIILKQKKLSEIQKDFVNNMTHEFKTPLASISMSADVISKPGITEEPERLTNYVSIIKKQASLLLRHIENILQVADSNLEKIVLEKKALNIHSLIHKVIENTESTINEANGKVQLFLNAEKSKVIADEYHVLNLFVNLIDNALKYSDKPLIITINTWLNGKTMYISFADNGPGIPKKFHAKVFNKFFRVPSGNVHNVKGFGLGLSYVKKVINFHHWKIKIESEEGKGSKFIIRIKKPR